MVHGREPIRILLPGRSPRLQQGLHDAPIVQLTRLMETVGQIEQLLRLYVFVLESAQDEVHYVRPSVRGRETQEVIVSIAEGTDRPLSLGEGWVVNSLQAVSIGYRIMLYSPSGFKQDII